MNDNVVLSSSDRIQVRASRARMRIEAFCAESIVNMRCGQRAGAHQAKLWLGRVIRIWPLLFWEANDKA